MLQNQKFEQKHLESVVLEPDVGGQFWFLLWIFYFYFNYMLLD